MNLKCPHCENISFKIVREHAGSQFAKCLKCGAVTAFAVAPQDPLSKKKDCPPAPDNRSTEA